MPYARGEQKDNDLLSKSYKTLPNGRLQVLDNLSVYTMPYTSHHYNNLIYVLADGGTFSAATILVACLKKELGATVIGQETGGNEGSVDGGIFSIITLPATHLQLRFPHYRYFIASGHFNTGYGVLPDIEVVPTALQICRQQDAVMQKVKDILVQQYIASKK